LPNGTLLRSKQGKSVKLYGASKYVELPHYAKIISFDPWANIYRAETWVEVESEGTILSQGKKMVVLGEFWHVNWIKLESSETNNNATRGESDTNQRNKQGK
jgi:hypothetical protein